jgi:hypothetical protein
MTNDEVSACVNAAFPLPALLFCCGALALTFYLKRRHQLSLAATFKVMVGVEKVKHNKVSAAIAVLTLIVPLALWVLLGHRCG